MRSATSGLSAVVRRAPASVAPAPRAAAWLPLGLALWLAVPGVARGQSADELRPEVELLQGYTDNSLYVPQGPSPVGEFESRITPGLGWTHRSPRWGVDARGAAQLTHRSQSGDTLYGSSVAALRLQPSARLRAELQARGDWGDDRQLLADRFATVGPNAPLTRGGGAAMQSLALREQLSFAHAGRAWAELELDERDRLQGSADLGFRQEVPLSGASDALREYATAGYGLRLLRRVGHQDSAGLSWDAGLYRSDGRARTYFQGGGLVWERELSPRGRATLEAGLRVAVATQVSDPVLAPILRAGVAYRWRRLETLLQLERSLLLDVTLGGSTLSYSATGAFRLRLDRSTELAGGATATENSLTLSAPSASLQADSYRMLALDCGLRRRIERNYEISATYRRLFVLPYSGDQALANSVHAANSLEVGVVARWF